MPGRPPAPPIPPPAVEPMSGPELRSAGERLYGSRGWQKGIGRTLDLDVSTVRRYVDMERVPTVVAAAIRHLELMQRQASPTMAGGTDGRETGGVSPGQVPRQRSSVGR